MGEKRVNMFRYYSFRSVRNQCHCFLLSTSLDLYALRDAFYGLNGIALCLAREFYKLNICLTWSDNHSILPLHPPTPLYPDRFQKISTHPTEINLVVVGRDLLYDPPLRKFQFSFIHCFKFWALQDPWLK